MAGGDSAFDGPLAGAVVKGSQIVSGVVLADLEVLEEGEGSAAEPVFGALGVGGRPLPPDADGAAETISARSADGLPVLAARDLRIEKARDAAPAEGTIYVAGYHGAELRFDRPAAGTSTATLRDSTGEQLVVDEDGVRQGAALGAADVLLAQPAIDLLNELGSFAIAAAGAINAMAPGSISPAQIANLTAKLVPYLAPGSPNAPTTRAPKLRGQPGP